MLQQPAERLPEAMHLAISKPMKMLNITFA